ncbi:hypothetical protein [Streptacidiphilus carbonis]|uniref:hypothetical protein n=1 Tax=Streptacidiphilus carbonis TaxID=105422 RepID=UPI000694817B|nr:hypothetical protein [Streptacidiphilus carbonis]
MAAPVPDHVVVAHDQAESHRYTVHYPEHGSRPGDPHYRDFNHYHQATKHDPEVYQCAVGKRRGDFADCVLDKPLELHHTHIEWALQNEVDLAALERQYPGVSTPDEVGAWVETAANLEWLCQFHHRGHGGAHVASASDFEGQHFVKGLIS